MNLTLQLAFLNVSDLTQSIDFYREVFDLRLATRQEEVSALMVHEETRQQVLVLREVGRGGSHGGRRNIGLRMISFETGSLEELDVIEQRLVERKALVSRTETETYKAVIAVDPDRVEIGVASSLTGTPISSEDWNSLHDMVYTIE